MNANQVPLVRPISTSVVSQITNGTSINPLTPLETTFQKVSADKSNMYSKPLLRKYITEGLHRKEWSEKDFADRLGVTPSNLSRALHQEGFNLTLGQFANVVSLLEFTPEQITHILTGKKAKEATSQLLLTYAKKIIDGLDG